MAQKRPQSLCQVHAQQSNVDDTEGGFLQVRHDAVEPIAALANSKFALDNVMLIHAPEYMAMCSRIVFADWDYESSGGQTGPH